MPLVPAGPNHAAQMEALIEQSRSLTLGKLVSFFFPNQDLDLLCQQTADGGSTTRSQNFGLAKRLLVQANCDILLGHNRGIAKSTSRKTGPSSGVHVGGLHNSTHTDLPLAEASAGDVVGGLHSHERVHFHAKRFFYAECHVAGKIS